MSRTSDRLGRYRLVERIGQGGMAEVWKATAADAPADAPPVVVKRLLPHLADDERFVAMFVAEARLGARLKHANIVALHELGEADGEPFLVLELVDGINLGALLRHAGGPLDPAYAAVVVRDVCRALAYVHDLRDAGGKPLGVLHRDVTPSNIMVARDGTVKLVDFGIAKAIHAVGDERTRTGLLKGKLAYVSPEQANGGDVDHRSDLFAAGVVLYEALTGERLFRAPTDVETLRRVRSMPVPRPSWRNRAVPPALDAIVARALARPLDERYARADELAGDLDRVVQELGWEGERSRALVAAAVESSPHESAPQKEPSTQPLGAEPPRARVTPASAARRIALGALAALVAVALVGIAVWRARSTAPPSPPPATPVSVASPAPARQPPAAPPPPPPPPPLAPAVAAKPTAQRRPHRSATAAAPTVAPPPPARPSRNDVVHGGIADPFGAAGSR